IISFMHVSLDGFVAGPNGEMDWITVNDEIFAFVGNRIRTGNTALYGRVTYEMMEAYWPTAADKPNPSTHEVEHSAWYKNIQKVVLSNTIHSEGLTSVIGDDLSQQIDELKRSGSTNSEDILLFGSTGATDSLQQLGLIDGYWLFLNPVILGKGIPLFAGIPDKVRLQLLSTHSFSCGVIELNYKIDS
ncbi:MAG: dihydrofolate reductase, partial [Flavobacterium sp.]